MENKIQIRRVVTGHDENGKAVVTFDDVINGRQMNPNAPELATIWSTDTFPSNNTEETDGALRKIGITSPGGTVFRVMELKPCSHVPLHTTQSMDYGFVIDGELDMELDNGVMVNLKKGDVLVQRGTIHAWHNNTDQVCRLVFVLVHAEK